LTIYTHEFQAAQAASMDKVVGILGVPKISDEAV
jgi:hypothetical protein